MASYYYLISSLPMLKTGGEPSLDYTSFLSMCKTAVSPSTYAALESLSAKSDKGPLLAKWSAFYRSLTDELNYQRRVKLGQSCTPLDSRDADAIEGVAAALAAQNPLESENILLKLEFSRLDSMIGLHVFDDDALFGYAIKLKLLERQRGFQHEAGKAEFHSLLDHIQQQIFSI